MAVDVSALVSGVQRYADMIAGDATRIMRDRIQGGAPRKTSFMRTSDTVTNLGRGRRRLEFAADYASYVDEGTPPHQIRPRNARVLRFRVGGKTVFARVVNHPGTKPTKWFSGESEQSDWTRDCQQAVERRGTVKV